MLPRLPSWPPSQGYRLNDTTRGHTKITSEMRFWGSNKSMPSTSCYSFQLSSLSIKAIVICVINRLWIDVTKLLQENKFTSDKTHNDLQN